MTVKEVAKVDCSGCRACKNICPTDCITFHMDEEGFYYPVIDEEKCIHCGLCYKTCLERPKANATEEVNAYAAYVKDNEILRASSSGGIFSLLAEKILEKGGVVYGAAFENMQVKHIRIDGLGDLCLIQKSKYLQSDIGLNYRQAKADLEGKKTVLFSGTPCQISGLYAYLKKEYDNLITCDVVCHGVPSEKVYRKFVEYKEKQHKKKMTAMYFRDKRHGWHHNMIVEMYEDGSEEATQSYAHPFQRGFLDNVYLRPSCYECKACGIPRVADISLADYWNADRYSKEFSKENADRGMSIVVLSSDKGRQIFDQIKKEVFFEELSVDAVKECSRHSYLPPEKNPIREEFFSVLPRLSYKKLLKKYIFVNDKKEKLTLRIKNFLYCKYKRLTQ